MITTRLLLIYIFCIFTSLAFGQSYSYTSHPKNAGTPMEEWSCTAGGGIEGTCGYTYLGNTIKIRVSNISGNKITFEIQKCNGSNFTSGTKIYLKQTTSMKLHEIVCGAESLITNNAGGKNSFSKTVTVSHSGRMNFIATTVGTTDRYRSNIVAIDAHEIANQPPTTPSNPTPSNGATNIPTTTTLSWKTTDPEGGAVGYMLYLGTSSSSMIFHDSGTGTSKTLAGLQSGTKYYWKIIANDNKGATTNGPVWTFTTQVHNQPPTVPTNPSPTNNATNVNTSPTLSWNTSDPEGGAVGYMLYLGTSSSSMIFHDSGTGTSKTLAGLQSGTKYYWKIIANDNKGATTNGPVWTFTTNNDQEPIPTNNSISLAAQMYFGAASLIKDQTYTFVTKIKNNGTSSWSGTVSLKKGTKLNTVITWNETIPAGATITLSKQHKESEVGNHTYKLYYQTSGTSTDIEALSDKYNNSLTVSVSEGTSKIVLDSDFSFGSSNLTIGQAYTLTGYIKNTGNVTYEGDLILRETDNSFVGNTTLLSITPGARQKISISFIPDKIKSMVNYTLKANNNTISTNEFKLPTVSYITSPITQTKYGNIEVIITNSERVTGSGWVYYNNNGTSSIRRSGEKIKVPIGSYTIAFVDVNGWSTPNRQQITVYKEQTQTVRQSYTSTTQTSDICNENCYLGILSPSNGSSDIPTKPAVIWSPVPDANRYEVECFDLNGKSIGHKKNIPATNLEKEIVNRIDDNMTLQYNTKYKLVVRAYKNNNLITCGSSQFTTRNNKWELDHQNSIYLSEYWNGQNYNIQKYFGEPLGHHNNVIAYFNGRHEWQREVAKTNGLCNWAVGGAGYVLCKDFQCINYGVAYFAQHHKLKLPLKTAKTYEHCNLSQYGINYIAYKAGKIPPIGALLVYQRSHVAIVTYADNQKVRIIQQNGYPFEEDVYYSDFPHKTIVGWQTPATISLKFVENLFSIQTDIQGHINNYRLIIKKADGDCYQEIKNSPIDIKNSSSNRVFLEKGTYVARVVGSVSGGEIYSNLAKFSLSKATETIITQPGSISVYTSDNTTTRTKTEKTTSDNHIVSNAKIYQKIDNQLIEKGYTNEKGKLFVEFFPSLQVNDVLIAEAEGYETLESHITQEMIDRNIINLQLNRKLSAKIVNPQVHIVDYKPIYTESIVTFNVKAENLNTYRISLLPNCECEPEISETYSAKQNTVSISGLSEGENSFEISFFNETDTLALYRTIYYDPSTVETNDKNIITIRATEESIGAHLYVSGKFVKEITYSGEVVIVPSGIQQLLFEKEGFRSYSENIDISTTIHLELEKIEKDNDTSIEQINDSKSLNIFPNPVTQLLYIEFDNESSYEAQITLYNLSGQIIYKATTNENRHTINMQNLNSGIYLLSVKTQTSYLTEKIMKK